jgi:hypothetical protein
MISTNSGEWGTMLMMCLRLVEMMHEVDNTINVSPGSQDFGEASDMV